MFIPLYDGVPLTRLRRPLANYALIAINVIAFVVVTYGPLDPQRIDLALGMIPAVVFDHAVLAKGLALVPAWVTPFTGMFLHASWLHLAGNMLFLWVFGDNVEDAMGSARYVVFYLASGFAGAMLYALMAQTSQAPLIGASGSIAGIIAAYMILYPRARILGLAFTYIPLRIPAVWMLGVWFLLQLFAALTSAGADVGWWAHVGGFAFGALLTPVLRRRDTGPVPPAAPAPAGSAR
jgi:membrane associated rhomboid family serine protease